MIYFTGLLHRDWRV